MATYGSALRRGLPRSPGGDPWPPAGAAPVDAGIAEASPGLAIASDAAGAAAAVGATPVEAPQSTGVTGSAQADAVRAPADEAVPLASAAGAAPVAVRRGLPRVAGGDPWPEIAEAPAKTATPAVAEEAAIATAAAVASSAEAAPVSAAPVAASSAAVPASTAEASTVPVRRGLPREPGGAAWPDLAAARMPAPAAAAPAEAAAATSAADATPAAAGSAVAMPAETPPAAVAPARDLAPLPFTPTVWPGRAASHRPVAKPEPARIGPFTKAQWAGAVIVGGAALLFAAGMAVLLVRFLLSLPALQDFLVTYPGEYHLPDGAPVGLPAWLGWQHFFNVFLMVLIIRSGLTIRHEKRPAVFWTPKRNPKGKTSLTIWFHQSLDLLWILNGLVFVVLLFVTGQWMRIVPTSWEVIPNAVSAALQYVSLDWPTENGWVNYNALQQLAYFSTVFIAAPLAIVTGFRMSGLWPKKNEKLSAAYPIEWARKLHFPTMLFFVVFIVIHVFLVFATGALRNLNHMYAAQGSVDPNAYADNWTGFWFFVASLVVIAVAWVAARPLVLAPIARMFGTVSGR